MVVLLHLHGVAYVCILCKHLGSNPVYIYVNISPTEFSEVYFRLRAPMARPLSFVVPKKKEAISPILPKEKCNWDGHLNCKENTAQ